MIPLKFDIQLSKTIRIIRELRGIKQITIAQELKIDQSTYSRIERGDIMITPGQLDIIAKELKASTQEIMSIVNVEIDRLQNSILFMKPLDKPSFSPGEIDLILSKLTNESSNKTK